MLPKDEFIHIACSGNAPTTQMEEQLEEEYESAAEAAHVLRASMPSIGILSVQKRLNAFFAVCRHIDQLVAAGQISESGGQLSILILRLADPSFKKAATMFDLRGSRYDLAARAEMPRSARRYLASLQVRGQLPSGG